MSMKCTLIYNYLMFFKPRFFFLRLLSRIFRTLKLSSLRCLSLDAEARLKSVTQFSTTTEINRAFICCQLRCIWKEPSIEYEVLGKCFCIDYKNNPNRDQTHYAKVAFNFRRRPFLYNIATHSKLSSLASSPSFGQASWTYQFQIKPFDSDAIIENRGVYIMRSWMLVSILRRSYLLPILL